jgi:hypothetical protein
MSKIFDIVLDNKGHLRKRESFDLEFKQNFQMGDNLVKYIKSLVGMANNKGGQIIYGIKDKPRLALGMTNNRFREVDTATIDRLIREYFSHELIWGLETIEFDNKEFGQIWVEESEYKPIICKKNKDDIIREGAIYYRYRGEAKEIEFAELNDMLQKERDKEKNMWMQHIQKISMIGPQFVHLLDSVKGEISVGSGKILIDKNVLDKIKFVKEGHFIEGGAGTPTLKLIGEITGVVDAELALPTDSIYPLFTNDLQEKLGLNSFEIQAVFKKLNIKGNSKYHTEIKSGQLNKLNKYSESLIPLIKRMLNRPDFLKICITEYKSNNKRKIKTKQKK